MPTYYPDRSPVAALVFQHGLAMTDRDAEAVLQEVPV